MNTRDALDQLRNDPQAMEEIAANASAQQMMVLLRALLAECRPYVEYEREARERELMFAGGIVSVVSRATHERDACDSLLARIDAAVTSAPARLGRPPRADRAQVRARINVTLPRDVADYLTALGDGNRSQAIVELARASAMARDSAIPVLPADQNAGV